MSETKSSALGTAVITGASSGIGKVYAYRLAERGYDLLLIADKADRLQEIQNDLQSRFRIRVQILVVDLSSPAGLAEADKRICSDDSITMLVNNAGASSSGPLSETSLETLQDIIALNVLAMSALSMAVLPGFQERDAGTIINIGSVAGFAPYPPLPIYSPSKAYQLSFTQVLQKQLAHTGIRVQLVAHGVTASEIWDEIGLPLSQFDPSIIMTTEDCVDAALAGLDKGELITIPSVHNENLLRNYETASVALLAAGHVGEPAPRYGVRK